MEKIEKGELLTLDNDREYSVEDIVSKNGNRYIYLVHNTEDINHMEVLLCKETEVNGEITLDVLTDKDEIADISNELLKGFEV